MAIFNCNGTSLIPRLQAVVGLSFIGLAVAGYSLIHHFGTEQGWCDVSDTLNCDIVNRGPYSEIAGIPVALFGLLGYAGLCAVSIVALKRAEERAELWRLIKAGIIVALLFSLYLTYLEAFVLTVYCPLCLTSFAAVIGMAVVAFVPARAVKI